MRTDLLRCAVMTVVLGVASILLLPASPLAGQSTPADGAGVDGAAEAVPGVELRGDALDAIADGKHADRVARQLVRLAIASDVDERERAETLQLAARLYWHVGDLDAARRTLTRAGLVAYRADASRLAVDLFLDAAKAALEEGDQRAAWTAAQRAGKVIHRANFSVDERLRLLARVVYADQPATLQTIPPLANQ